MKKMFEFKTKTIVATGIGAALFMLLFMYVKVPTGIPETDVHLRRRPVRLPLVELGGGFRHLLLHRGPGLSAAEGG